MALTESNKIVAALKKQLGLDEDTFAALQAWENEAAALAPYAKLAGVKKGQLFVSVVSSAQFQELTLLRPRLIEKINGHFGGRKVIKSIKVQLADGTAA